MSTKPEPAILSHDTGQQIPCFDSFQLSTIWISNIKHVPSYGNGATLLFFTVLVLPYVSMDSHTTTKIFEIDGLPNFLSYSASLAGLQSADKCSAINGTDLLKDFLCDTLPRGSVPYKKECWKEVWRGPLKGT